MRNELLYLAHRRISFQNM